MNMYRTKLKPFFAQLASVLLVVLAFVMPIWINIAILIIPLLLLSCFLGCSWRGFGGRLLKNRFAVLMMLFWLLHLVGVLYSNNWQYGLRDVQHKLSFLAFPLFFVLSADAIKIRPMRIANAFLVGCLTSMMVCLTHALIQSLSFEAGRLVFNLIPADVPWENNFTYARLAFLYHPSYLAMYISFAVVLLFSKIKETASSKKRALYSLAIICSGIFIFLLSSRAGILIGAFAFLLGTISLSKHWRTIVIAVAAVAVVIGVSAYISYKNNGLLAREITGEMLRGNNLRNLEYGNEQEPRIAIWRVIPEVVAQKLLLGHGTGDTHEVLNAVYLKHNNVYAAENNYNAHNQYLETAVALGIVGLLVLLMLLLYPLYFYWKSESFFVPFAFISILMANLMVESMASRIVGVMFFALFYCLFFCTDHLLDSPKCNQ